MLAETVVAALRKGNERCFTCGDKNHLKRDCPKKANNKPPKICPRCRREKHWAKECKSKFDIEGKPIPGNSKQETTQVPFNKNQGKFHLFPQPLNLRQCCSQYTSPKLLYPPAVPSRIPTGLFGPLPPRTFGLLSGRSSLT